MKWLEIIELRAASSQWDSMKAQVNDFIDELNSGTDDHLITAFSRAKVESDFSIHLTHDTSTVEKNGSSLGTHLVSILKDFGIVNHSVWIEL